MNYPQENSKEIADSGIKTQPLRVLLTGKPFFFVNQNYRITDCSPGLLDLLKGNREHIINTSVNQFPLNNLFIEALDKAQQSDIHIFSGCLKAGELSAARYNMVLVKYQGGKPSDVGTLCFVLDVVKELGDTRGSQVQLPIGVSIHTTQGKPVYISPEIQGLLGYSESELNNLVPPLPVYHEDVKLVENAIQQLAEIKNFRQTSYRMVHKNGSLIHVDSIGYYIPSHQNGDDYIVNLTTNYQYATDCKLKQQDAIDYQSVLMNLPAGVAMLSPNGDLLDVNDALREMMDYKQHSTSGINILKVAAMKQHGLTNDFSKCAESRQVINGNYEFISPFDGQLKYYSYSFIPIEEPNGKLEKILCFVSDHSKQKSFENDKYERDDFLEKVINSIKTPFFVKDEQHTWIMLNDAAVEMMGRPRESLIGFSDYDFYPEQQAEAFWKSDNIALEEKFHTTEEQITWSDGSLHTILTHKYLYVEKHTGKRYIIGTIHDVTVFKRIEQGLRASENHYRELFDSASDYIITTDLDGKVTHANQTLLHAFGIKLDQITGLNIFKFAKNENYEQLFLAFNNLKAGHVPEPFEVEISDYSRQSIIYQIKASLIRENESVTGVQCVFSDVTNAREASAKLEKYNSDLLELNQTKDKFFSIIAHDLRNPYSSMIGFSELLLEELDTMSKDEIRDSLKIIRNAARNSLNLLENLLAWSRLATGRMSFDPVKIAFSSLVDEVIDVLFSLAYRKKIELVNKIDPGIMLLADKNMLNTILNNLLMNAIKFTPSGGTVTISSEDNNAGKLESGWVNIIVTDTGIGMETDFCQNLFSLRKPHSSPGTEKEQGTGLGLILSREMVERHGGAIKAESTPGIGSTFTFSMPLYV